MPPPRPRRRGFVTKSKDKVPSPDDLLVLLHERGGHISVRDLARELDLRGGDKAELKRRLRAIHGQGGKHEPSMAYCEVIEQDTDGELWAESTTMPGAAILILDNHKSPHAPQVGDRLLARLERQEDGAIFGRVFKILPKNSSDVVGVIQKSSAGWWLMPSRKDAKRELRLEDVPEGIASGDLVRAELTPGRPLAPPKARIVERFGRYDEPAAVSMSVAVELGLPIVFPANVIAAAEKAKPVKLGKRTDLRAVPLVTIDGADARDFDDAVWAERDSSANNPNGFRAIVAIADVAHYVLPGSPLDVEAAKRGNSVYFPDRVLPMLPEALSNGLCSLRPDEDRACVSCHMRFSADGKLLDWSFKRSVMRSVARLTYEQVQLAADGQPDQATQHLMEPVLTPLYALFERLLMARRERGTIELEIPERQVVLDAEGAIERIVPRVRLTSHMLIEELMIAANVAAAKVLEKKGVPCIYRVHDRPDALKLEALIGYVAELGLTMSRNAKSQKDFNRLLSAVDDDRLREQLAQLILRSQSQAIYSADNIGHFGLNLQQYAHFTSPIRRYSDLILHRLLITNLGLVEQASGGALEEEALARVSEQVSATERKASDAERKSLARYIALFMASQEGATFAGRIASVQRFGFFVSLDDTGADGLVPVASLGDEWFEFDEARHVLAADRSKRAFGIGDRVSVTLVEADTIKGMLLFAIDRHEPSPATLQAAAKVKRRRGGKQRNFRHRGRGR